MATEAELNTLVDDNILTNGRRTSAANHRVVHKAIIAAIFQAVPFGESKPFKGEDNFDLVNVEVGDYRITIEGGAPNSFKVEQITVLPNTWVDIIDAGGVLP